MISKTLKLLFACTPLPVLQHANLALQYELSFVQPMSYSQLKHELFLNNDINGKHAATLIDKRVTS
jgi:hypothetical protein